MRRVVGSVEEKSRYPGRATVSLRNTRPYEIRAVYCPVYSARPLDRIADSGFQRIHSYEAATASVPAPDPERLKSTCDNQPLVGIIEQTTDEGWRPVDRQRRPRRGGVP